MLRRDLILILYTASARAKSCPFQFWSGRLLHIKDTTFCPFDAPDRTVQRGDSPEKGKCSTVIEIKIINLTFDCHDKNEKKTFLHFQATFCQVKSLINRLTVALACGFEASNFGLVYFIIKMLSKLSFLWFFSFFEFLSFEKFRKHGRHEKRHCQY